MGFLGILEDKHLPHVPATVVLNEADTHLEDLTAGLKHATGKNAHIVLVPQPSEDPNDPLNWSMAKKYTITLIIIYGATIFAATISPMLNPALVIIATQFNRPVGDITLVSGYQLLLVGASGPFISGFSRKYGKRPVFVFSALMGLVGTIIGSATNNYNGLLACRLVQGLSTSAFESLIVSMMGDLFFVHERGLLMAMVQFILGAMSNFTAIICGPIAANLGWKYLFHLLIAFAGLGLILIFFFVPETQYNRDHRYDIDELADEKLEELAKVEKRHRFDRKSGTQELEKIPTAATSKPISPKKSFVQELALYNGTFTNENLIQLFIAPIAVLLNLVVAWQAIVSGMFTALYVAQAYVLAQIFSFPPYNLTAAGVGYLSLGPFLGGLFAAAFMGVISDPIIKWASKKNKGIYEPEYRLLPMVFSLTTGVGLIAFGYMCQHLFSYYATATMHGLSLFGIVVVTTSSCSYAIDAYREMSSEIFIIGMMLKNFVFYGFSYFVNNWTASAGPQVVFESFGGVAFAMALTTPIIFVFGKRYRSFWFRTSLLQKLKVHTHAEV